MKKLATAILLFIPLFLYGQVDYLDEKNLVSSIKKDAGYIYGEGIGDCVIDARNIAEDFLLAEIKQWMQEGMSPAEAASVSVKKVMGNACVVQFKRGDMDRIFLYVAKENVSANSQPCNGSAPVEVLTVVELVEPEPAMVEEYIPDIEDIEIEVIEFEPEIVEYIREIEPEIEEVAVVIEEPVADIVQDGTWLNRFLAAPDMNSLLALLKAAKEDYKVMWGEVKSQMEPGWYIVPFSGNEIKAVLSPSRRVNLLTGEQDALRNYNNNRKIWFIIYE